MTLTRRDFLKRTLMAAGAIAMPSLAGCLVQSENSTIQNVIDGCPQALDRKEAESLIFSLKNNYGKGTATNIGGNLFFN